MSDAAGSGGGGDWSGGGLDEPARPETGSVDETQTRSSGRIADEGEYSGEPSGSESGTVAVPEPPVAGGPGPQDQSG